MHDRIITTLKGLLIQRLFVEIPPEQIGLDDGLQTVVGLDSVAFKELQILCENQFGIVISDEEFSPENFRSLGSLSCFIERKQVAAKGWCSAYAKKAA